MAIVLFYTWLYRIAVNTAKNYLTAQGRRSNEDIAADEAESYDVGANLRIVDTPENEILSSELKKLFLIPLVTYKKI